MKEALLDRGERRRVLHDGVGHDLVSHVGLLAGLVGHLHSHSLLRRIRALAGADFAVGGEEGAP